MKRFFAACAVLMLCAATAAQAQENPAAAMRCTRTGGVVQSRIPELGANGTTGGLVLAHPKQFCAYGNKDGSSFIYVLLRTLDASKPTLAALAYYAELPFNSAACPGGASPGSCYCSQIGGTDVFGGDGYGGAWVDASDPVNPDLDACVFPDLSIIDSYGLFYHSRRIIRGRNLDGRLAYKNPYDDAKTAK